VMIWRWRSGHHPNRRWGQQHWSRWDSVGTPRLFH